MTFRMLNIKKSCWLALLFICSVFLPLNGQHAVDGDQDLSLRILAEIRNVEDFFSLISAKDHASDELRWKAMEICRKIFTEDASIVLSLPDSSAKKIKTFEILENQYKSGGSTPIITDMEVIDPLFVSELRPELSKHGNKIFFGDIGLVVNVCFPRVEDKLNIDNSSNNEFNCEKIQEFRTYIKIVAHKTYTGKGEFFAIRFDTISIIPE